MLATLIWIILAEHLTFAMPACDPPKRVLITAFKPFAGNIENGSELVARELLNLNQSNPCIVYEACILPTVSEKATKVAQECFQKSNPRPDLVISTGESGCEINVETRAHNFYRGPNEKGQFEERVLDQAAGKEEIMTLPAAEMWCASRGSTGVLVKPSVEPAYWVCNQVAFQLSRYFKPLKIPFGFIHLPMLEDKACKDKVRLDETTSQFNSMVVAALKALEDSNTIFAKQSEGKQPCLSNAKQTRTFNSVITSSCRREFENQIRKQRIADEKFFAK